MPSRSTFTTTAAASGVPSAHRPSRLYREGITAGLVGGAVIAIWFLMLDTLAGHPLYTPSVLGSALFMGREGLVTLRDAPVSLGMVAAFSCVHWLVFATIGSGAAWLLALAERIPSLGLGVLFVFLIVVFEFGFLGAAVFFSEVMFYYLSWQAVLFGNFLAAVAMGAYLWWRHPSLALHRITGTFFSPEEQDE